ncbi:MAG: hypothetical protein IMZ53_03205 [Thermoplasmata archaeon]|nr:hypothetical protein [Thermoplasmata archaeon]
MNKTKTSIRANPEQLALREDEKSSTQDYDILAGLQRAREAAEEEIAQEQAREYYKRLERSHDVARELRGY